MIEHIFCILPIFYFEKEVTSKYFRALLFILFCHQFQTVSREIRKILTERARFFNIALDDVSITSLSFGKEFTHAIEAKQVAAQEAERAKFIVEKAEQDKRSAIIRAQVRNQLMKQNESTISSYFNDSRCIIRSIAVLALLPTCYFQFNLVKLLSQSSKSTKWILFLCCSILVDVIMLSRTLF